MKKYRTFPLFLLVTIFFITSTVLPTRVTFAKHPSMRSGKSLLTNGDFSTDLEEGWLIHNQGDYEEWAGLADFSIENGELKVEVSQVGWEWWHIQLYQEPVEITAGSYKIAFDMRSDIERPVYVELTGSDVPRQDFIVDNTMKTYEAIIDVASDGNYKFMFGLGRDSADEEFDAPYSMFIDNVLLERIDEIDDNGSVEPEDSAQPGEGNDNGTPEDEEPIERGDWTLVWSDEFDGAGSNLNPNGIDLDKWSFQEGTGEQYGLIGWGNDEKQYYRKENAFVEDGTLIIEARNDGFGGMPYTSARICTAETFTKKYGRFEARIKLPEGQGFWPAFWMMPADDVYGGWAASGEIDIMEARGRLPNEVSGYIHYGGSWPNNTSNGDKYIFPDDQDITQFHEYALEWEPGELRWYVDGELYCTMDNWYSKGTDEAAKYSFPAPFDQEFYIILNLAVGGNFDGGLVPPDEAFPARMEVDYVRVYELTGRSYKEVSEPIIEKEDLPPEAKLPLGGGGNWIYDINYEQAFTVINTAGQDLDPLYWNLVYLPEFGGAASASVEKLHDKHFARIDISNGGHEPHSVQLIQNVTLGKGRRYKLSFDAKASALRHMNVKLGAGADRGWVLYSRDEKISLSDEIKTYEIVFEMDHDTDTKARLEFNMGQNTSSIWIGNVRLEEVEQLFDENGPKPPLNNGNHIYNGTFDQGYIHRMTFWNVLTNKAQAEAYVSESERQLKVSITDGGSASNDIKVVQKGIDLRKGNEYKITFDGKATGNRPITVQLTDKENRVVYVQKTINLDTSMREFEFYFTMNDESDNMTEFQFLLGGYDNDVYIDNVKMIRTSIDYSDVDIYPLKNGDFLQGKDYWDHWNDSGGASIFAVDDKRAQIAITSTGSNPWSVGLGQGDMSFTRGIEYILSFDARATLNRPIEVVIENGGYHRYLNEIIDITTGVQNYEFIFTVDADDIVDLKILMGNIEGMDSVEAHDIFIENVILQVNNPPVLKSPELVADTENNKVNQEITIIFNDDLNWRNGITSIEINGKKLGKEQYTVTDGKITFTADNFLEAGNYTITIRADGYVDAKVIQPILDPEKDWIEIGENLLINGDFSTDLEEGWLIHNQGDYEEWAGLADFSIENGELKVEVSQVGWEWWHIQLYQEPVEVTAGSYKIAFDMRSDIERPVYVELTGSDVPRQDFIVDNTMKTYEAIIDVASDGNYKFMFGLGRDSADEEFDAPYSIFIDGVKLVKVEIADDEDPIDEDPVDEDPADEDPVDEDPIDEDPVDEDPVDEDPIDEDPVDEDPVDEDPIDEDPVDEDPIDEDPIDEDPVDEDPKKNGETFLVKTGSRFDFKILLFAGIVLIIIGIGFILRNRKENIGEI